MKHIPPEINRIYEIHLFNKAIKKTVKTGFLGCHISHTYHTGASLYFTFGCQQIPGYEIEQYLFINKAAESSDIDIFTF